jgi:putative ATPase
MVVAGEDPRFIARRLVISAAEDIGMADPNGLVVAQAAADAVSFVGMPEGRIILAEATTYLATAPKSNRSYLALDRAIADVKDGRAGNVPTHLRNPTFSGTDDLGYGQGYVYAHDEPHGVAKLEYLPETLRGTRYYEPTDHGLEKDISTRLERIRTLLGRGGKGK